MPRKIASVKNAKPSSANGSPIDSPNRPMKRGHSRPSSNDSTVPDTAPTANKMLVPLASCFESSRYSGSRVRRCCTSASTISAGSATPAAANTMWNASEIPIWRSRVREAVPVDRHDGILRRTRPAFTFGVAIAAPWSR